jgi:signal transduction histidine kinase
MTRDVLDTESIESGRFGYVKHDVDLTEEVRTAVEAFSTDSAELLEVELPETPVTVNGDADRIQQVLSNLIDNARKSSPPGSPVKVVLEDLGGTARITVEDRGSGIDTDQLERIFDKFVRGRAGTVTGTGLGLYISRRIIDAHEGRIWAESTPGEATRFVVELPSHTSVPTRMPTP